MLFNFFVWMFVKRQFKWSLKSIKTYLFRKLLSEEHIKQMHIVTDPSSSTFFSPSLLPSPWSQPEHATGPNPLFNYLVLPSSCPRPGQRLTRCAVSHILPFPSLLPALKSSLFCPQFNLPFVLSSPLPPLQSSFPWKFPLSFGTINGNYATN